MTTIIDSPIPPTPSPKGPRPPMRGQADGLGDYGDSGRVIRTPNGVPVWTWDELVAKQSRAGGGRR